MKNREKLLEVLLGTGLSPNEAGVYLTALSLGATTALALSRASGIKRTTIYSVIETLKQRGLMAEELKGLKTVFVPSDPLKLKEVADERKQQLETNMSEFSTLYNLRDEQGTLRYYQGLEAVKGVYDSILRDIKPNEFYLVIADTEHWQKLDQKYFDSFVDRRAKMELEMRLLFTNSGRAQHMKKFERNFNQKVKILPEGTVLSASIIITPQKIVIHQYNLPISAIVIQTKSAIQSQKEMFELIWNSLPND
ncbi:MAG TPA: helix-turn-helix domain-containing protein [Candidatus Paceibacterota bacterium]